MTSIFRGSDNFDTATAPKMGVIAPVVLSGTFVDFTAIPAWAKEITIIFDSMSSSGADEFLVQLGAGAVETTGYASTGEYGGAAVSSTAGFLVRNSGAANAHTGHIILTSVGGNRWVASGVVRPQAANTSGITGGAKTVGGTLDRFRVTTTVGANTLDLGSVSAIVKGY